LGGGRPKPRVREGEARGVRPSKEEGEVSRRSCTGKGRECEKALWRRAEHKSAVMWEALWGEDHTPLDLLVTDKEEAYARLAQLPGARRQDIR
jgi:hypothetical protein